MRFCENIALRVTSDQRAFLESYAIKNDMRLCAGIRHLIDRARKSEA